MAEKNLISKWLFAAIVSANVISVSVMAGYSHNFKRQSERIHSGESRALFGEQLNTVQGIFSCIWTVIFVSIVFTMKLNMTASMAIFFLWPHIIIMYNLIRNTKLYNRKIKADENSTRISNASANASMVMNGIIAVGILLNIIQSITSSKQVNKRRQVSGSIIIVMAILISIISKFMSGDQKLGSYGSHVNLIVKENTVLIAAALLLFGIYVWVLG